MKKIAYHVLLLYSILCNPIFAQQVATRKVACMGDSVTAGYLLGNPIAEAYPSQLQGFLGQGYDVKNFGHSGATLLKKGHKPYTKTKAYQEALQFQPDIAIIHLGLNDTDPRNWPNFKQEFQSDYQDIIRGLQQQNPKVKIYICKMTPIFNEHPRFKSGTRDWYWEIQSEIQTVAKTNGVQFIDLHEKLYARPDLFPDALHPSKEGATIIAKTVYTAITGDFGGFAINPLFADHMVLQRHQPISIFGKANAGDQIEATFKGQKQSTTTASNGKWKLQFPAQKEGGPYELQVKCNQQTYLFKDILIGDVWFCSGQSNMAFPLQKAQNGTATLKKAAQHTQLRLLRYQPLRDTDDTPWDSLALAKTNELLYFSGKWQSCDSLSAKDFSAVAYFFGQKVQEATQIPIGLIQVAVGGSPIESWMDRYTMEHHPVAVDELTLWRKSDFFMPWVRERAEVNLQKALNPKQRHPYDPCYNFEAGVSAFTAFPVKGLLWYQGESNAHNASVYEQLLPLLAQSWRKAWGLDLPFYVVQLSSMNRPSWPEFRAMQANAVRKIPNSGLALSLDVGEENNVHPIQKEVIGDRLARLALKKVYQYKIEDQGPEISRAIQNKETLVLSFTKGQRLQTRRGEPLTGFELVTNHGKFVPIAAEIRNNQVVIKLPNAEPIQAIAYAWQPFTKANLINQEGLPCGTFKTKVLYK